MSPEQALAKRVVVDHRTDIYSLGVTLYELLTLQPAFPGRDRQELLRQIAFEEPKPPRKLNRAIPAELETIVLKAMAKNAAERYETAQDLADDLKRHLDDLPIRAKRPGIIQRATKWSRRHSSGVLTATAVLLLLSVGLAVSNVLITWEKNQKQRALDDRDQALAQAEADEAKARAATDLVLSAFSSADPYVHEGKDYKVRDLLDEFSRSLEGTLDEQPEVAAEIHRVIGVAYRHLFMHDAAEEHLTRSLDLHRQVYGQKHPLYAQAALDYATHILWWGEAGAERRANAVQLLGRTVPVFEVEGNQLGLFVAKSMIHQHSAFFNDPPNTQELFDELMELAAAMGDTRSAKLGVVVHNHALWKRGRKEFDDAERLARRAVELHLQINGPDHPETGYGYHYLGRCLKSKGGLAGAEDAFRRSLSVFEKNYEQHHQIPSVLSDLKVILQQQGKTDEAVALDSKYHHILYPSSAAEPTPSPEPAALSSVRTVLEEARSSYRRIAELEDRLAEDPADLPASAARELAQTRFRLGDLLKLLGQDQAAAELWRQALDGFSDPVVEYNVRITTPGTYRLYFRGDGHGGSSNSLYTRVAELGDGPGGSIADCRMNGGFDGNHADFSTKSWIGSGRSEGCFYGPTEPALWTFRESGDYTVQFMMREDGVALDAFVLQLASLPAPVGEGPPESERTDEKVFLESGGRVVAEAEHFSLRRPGPQGANWLAVPAEDAGDVPHSNYRGDGYLQALPDSNQLGYLLRRHPLLLEDQRLAWDLERYTNMIAAEPNDPELHYVRATTHNRLDRPEEADSDLQRALGLLPAAIEANPDDVEAHKLRARIHEDRKEYAPVIEACSRLIELTPADAEWWCKRGWMRGLQGDWKAALPDLSKAIELNPRNGNHWNVRAIAYRKLGQWEKAIDDYSKAIELHPASAYYTRRGVVYGKLKRYDRAIEDWSQAIKLDPDNGKGCKAASHNNRLSTFVKLERWDEAATECEELTALLPDSPACRYWSALLHVRQGEIEEYRNVCIAMLQRFGSNEDARVVHWIPWTCVLAPDALTDFARPVQLAEEVVKKNPGDPSYLDTLGGVLYRAGRLEEAIQRLTEAERLVAEPDGTAKSSPAYTWLFLAMAHQRTGQNEEAKKWFNKAVDYTDKVLAEEKQPGASPLSWNRRLTLELLRTEAAKLLAVTETPSLAEAEDGRTDEGRGTSDSPGNVTPEP
jgi:tetratricopeptide (TPR) repeat protein